MSFLGGRDHLDASLHGYRCGAIPTSPDKTLPGVMCCQDLMVTTCTPKGDQLTSNLHSLMVYTDPIPL